MVNKMTHRVGGGLALALMALGMTSGSAMAQDAEAWDVSANVAYTSDYRFRGVSLSDNNFAIQGGIDAAHESGVYVGTWASSIDDIGSETELDLYGGYGFAAGELSFDVGVIGYFYPGADDTTYYELYGSVSGEAGIVSLTGGVAYAPEQDNIGDDDNLYIYGDAGFPLGESPLSVGLHLGWEDGAFGDEKLDYSVSVGGSAAGLDIAVAYIDTENADGFGDISDPAFVLTVGKSM